MEKEVFERLYNLDLKNEEKKLLGKFNYLSWARAYKLAMQQDPNLKYEVKENVNGIPYFSDGAVHFVKTEITMFGETKAMFLPIMDNKHNAVAKPDSRDIGDSIMRCLAKNFAMFGLGLTLYNDEDLEKIKELEKERARERKKTLEWCEEYATTDLKNKILDFYKVKSFEDLSDEELKKVVSKIKKIKEEMKGETENV